MLVEKKKEFIEPFITHGVLFETWRKNFRSSLVLELYWEDEINYEFKNFTTQVKKSYFYSIIKKYFSYIIRKNKIISLLVLIIFSFIIFILNKFNSF